jgi:hypothetical protein
VERAGLGQAHVHRKARVAVRHPAEALLQGQDVQGSALVGRVLKCVTIFGSSGVIFTIYFRSFFSVENHVKCK